MLEQIRFFVKDRIKLFVILFVVLALGIGYFIGRVSSNRDRVLAKLETSLKSGDVSSLRGIVKLEGEKVSKKDLQPLVDYYDDNSKAVDNVISNLKNGQETSAFFIEENKRLGFYTYNIGLKVYDIQINSNFQEGEFNIGNEREFKSGDIIENIIPGIYTVHGELNGDCEKIYASKEIVLMKDESVQIDFDAINITVKSEYEDADLYVNGENSGIKVKDAVDIGPFKKDGTTSVYIEKEFPWGRIKGDEVSINDVPIINLSINMENDILRTDIKSVADEFYKSVFISLNNEEKRDICKANEAVKNKIYSIFEQKYIFLKNKYDINDIEVQDDKSEYMYENGVYKANIIVKIDYSISKNLFYFNKTNNSKKFFTKLIYDKSNDEWIVDDVENFSL